MAEPIVRLSPLTGKMERYVPFTLEELLTFDTEEIIARGREYLGTDWTPSWMLEQQRKGEQPPHA